MLLPMGACAANSMHSEITAGSTGRSRSSRLRTARVVVRTWSKSCKDMLAPNLLERRSWQVFVVRADDWRRAPRSYPKGTGLPGGWDGQGVRSHEHVARRVR